MTSPSVESAFADTRLHVVTGKGGVGKTTVAAALGVALAAQGKKVLLAEVEGRQGISQIFDVAPLGVEEVRLLADPSGGELWGLSVDAKAALLEYLQKFYKLGRAGSALDMVGATDFATTIAPGVRDVLLIGKVYEAAGRRIGRRGQGEFTFDAIVLDAPPTGRVGRFLGVNAEVADIARMGPIKNQAESIDRVLHQRTTRVHLVTLLEEMPVQETLDAVAELSAAGFGLGTIVNAVRSPLLDDDQRAALLALGSPPAADGPMADAVRADLASVGVRATGPMVRGLLAQGQAHALRLDLEAAMFTQVRAAGMPVATLPDLTDGTDSGGVWMLAENLLDQGVR